MHINTYTHIHTYIHIYTYTCRILLEIIGMPLVFHSLKTKEKLHIHTHHKTYTHKIFKGSIINHTTESEVLQGCYEYHSINHIKDL